LKFFYILLLMKPYIFILLDWEILGGSELGLILINNTFFTFSLDKLEKREEIILKTQAELLNKLDDANQIEREKIELFKKMFDANIL